MVLIGEGREGRKEVELEVFLDRVNGVQLGFDETFSRREDRQLGLFGFAPIRVKYGSEKKEKTLYLFAGFGRLPIRNCDNEEVMDELEEAIP